MGFGIIYFIRIGYQWLSICGEKMNIRVNIQAVVQTYDQTIDARMGNILGVILSNGVTHGVTKLWTLITWVINDTY